MKILVTGAAGYIGSVVTECLVEQGHQVWGFDNLKTGHRAALHPDAKLFLGDILSQEDLLTAFQESDAEAVVHLAAESLVEESMKDPGKFFRVNVAGGLNLLEAMRTNGVSKIVFSSTAAIYGEPERVPINEEDQPQPVNAYGESKLQFERIMRFYEQSFGLKHISLRYFNACGASSRFGEHRKKESHIIPLLFEYVLGNRKSFSLFGTDYPTPDGTCVRDYVHVIDIANAHIQALEKMDSLAGSAFNLGSGRGHSNLEVIKSVEVVTGKKIEFGTADRRAGDPAVLVASNDRALSVLGWQRKFVELDAMVESAWKWRNNHPDGYPE